MKHIRIGGLPVSRKKETKEYMDWVANQPCLVCGKMPVSLHHPRFCAGMSQRSPDFLVVPLCKEHHQDGQFGHAIHNGQMEFEKNYMSEEEMLVEMIKKLWRKT